jgi:hypothetical protein
MLTPALVLNHCEVPSVGEGAQSENPLDPLSKSRGKKPRLDLPYREHLHYSDVWSRFVIESVVQWVRTESPVLPSEETYATIRVHAISDLEALRFFDGQKSYFFSPPTCCCRYC